MRDEMKMTKRLVLVAIGGLALMLAPLVPSTTLAGHESTVKEMIEKGDHAGLAEYYEKEAKEAHREAAKGGK